MEHARLSRPSRPAAAAVNRLRSEHPGHRAVVRLLNLGLWGTRGVRATWLIAAIGLMLIACVWAAALNRIGDERAAVVEANLRDNDAAAVTLEQRTLRALKDADLTARLLKHLFERDGTVDFVAAFSKGLIRPDAYLVVSICDAGGHVILSSEARAIGLDIADREYFIQHAASDTGRLDISAPVGLRASRRIALQLTRRLNRADGSFAGIVLLSVDPAYFVDRAQASAQGTDSALSLFGTDGIYRAPPAADDMAAPLVSVDAIMAQTSKTPAGTFDTTSTRDGRRRIVSYRLLGEYPLVAVASRSRDAVLETFERRRLTYLGVATAASALVLLCFLVVTALVWQLKRSQQRAWANARELKLASTVFETTADGIMLSDASDRIVRVNGAFTKLTGFESRDVVGRVLADSPFAPLDPDASEMRRNQLLKNGFVTGEVTRRRKDGAQLALWVTATCVYGNDGRIAHYIRVFTDISTLKETQRQLEHLATVDMLTGLPNRRAFHERIHQLAERARRQQTEFGVMFVDLDGFKRVNDRHGHDVGDVLLQEVAALLKESIRASDVAFRLGGDEFTVLLDHVGGPRDAVAVAERVLAAVQALIVGGDPASVTGASIGIALYPDHGDDVAALIRHADAAMYAAKAAGRNRYRIYAGDGKAVSTVEMAAATAA